MRVIAAIHGILTGQTDASWPDKFQAWCAARNDGRDVVVVKKEYRAGPFPRLNAIKNRWLARSLAAELLEFERTDDLWFFAHSNGACVALLAARILAEEKFRRVRGLVLTGAACEADVDRNGVAAWVRRRWLERAISWSSAQDRVVDHGEAHEGGRSLLRRVRDRVWGVLSWPYGALGRTGWMRQGAEYEQPGHIETRWQVGGHSTYFANRAARETMFSSVLTECSSWAG